MVQVEEVPPTRRGREAHTSRPLGKNGLDSGVLLRYRLRG